MTSKHWTGLAAGIVMMTGAVSGAETLFPGGGEWRYRLGTSEASAPDRTAWRLPGFDDSGWVRGVTPIGYGPGVATSLGSSQAGGYLTVYLRREFEVENPADYGRLELPVRVDDGYVIWLNGVEVGRYNVPEGELAFDSVSVTFTSDPVEAPVTIANAWELLREGPNVLAVHLLNVNWTSSDLYFDTALVGVLDTAPPVVAEVRPPANAWLRQLQVVEVRFNKPVTGVEAGDLLINGVPATGVSMGEPGQFVFELEEPAAGTVTMAWAEGHGITDLTRAANPFGGGPWQYSLDPDAAPPGVVINEFMASNAGTLNDDDGDRSDWIEIHNAGEVAEDLGGWFLTDDAADLAQWRFPSVTLLPNRYLVVFASGKDRRDPGAPLHTNFRLSAEGEYLALSDARTNVVSEFAPQYPPQFPDVSYGRERADPRRLGFFSVPTPGAPNASSGAGFASGVRFSRAGGLFRQAFAVTLTAESPGARIHYTIDGTVPTGVSPRYTGPITVASRTQLRARAFEDGLLPGTPGTELYLPLGESLAGFNSNLPVLVFDNFGAGGVPGSPVTPRQFVAVAVFEPGESGRAALTDEAVFCARAGWNLRGSSTRGFPKSSYRIEFWDEFGDGTDRELLGMPAEEDWVLYAPNQFDVPLIHNPFAFQLSNDLGRYAPRTRMVEVFVNTTGGPLSGPLSSGHYRGVYVLMENIKRGSDRVAIERLAPEHRAAPEVTGGYLLKIDRRDADERDFSAAGLSLIYRYPDGLEMVTPQRSAQAAYLRNHFNAFYAALTGPNADDPVTGYEAYIDVGSWIDHHLVNVVTLNVDALRLSSHLFKGRERRIEMGPVWDFDRAMGTSKGGDTRPFAPRNWRGQTWDEGTDFFNPSGVFSNPWYSRLFQRPDFWQRYIDRYQALRETVFSDRHIGELVDRLAEPLREAQAREVARWGGSGASDTRPRSGTLSYNGYSHVFPGTFQGEIDFMKRWLADRLDFMDTNFLARPVVSEAPGSSGAEPRVRLSGPAGATLYYTVDGTDPRRPGGGISGAARVYDGAIPVPGNTRIQARAHDSRHRNLTGPNQPPISSSWSGLTAVDVIVEVAPLVISEMMFHPSEPTEGESGFGREDFEYLELYHRGTAPLNLDGFRFSRGIDYTFGPMTVEPGGRLVLAKDPAAFRARYGSEIPVLGPYGGQLDNAGECVAIVGRLDETVLEFCYAPDWQVLAGGFGFAMVIHDEHGPLESWNRPDGWRLGSVWQGTPGRAEPPPPELPVVWVNEALAHTDPPQTDSVELHNPGPSPADIGGWHLTDRLSDPLRFRIPDGTVIPAGGYVVFDEGDFNTGAPGSFALSSLGEEVYVFSGDAGGRLTGYFHGFAFGASENGVSFGRHVNYAGAEQFVAQAAATLGGPNVGPRVGPVILNELMYHPPPFAGTENNTRDEYIELHNLTDQPVPLFDPEHPGNGWRLRSAVRFDFPAGTVLPPGGFLLVVGFDPATASADLEAFRGRYGLAASVPILGPFEGRLDNSGERARLLRPDSPQDGGEGEPDEVPYILVDAVDYTNRSPWPDGANATGRSIQRLVASVHGDEPYNWQAADPTPGAPNLPSTRDSNGDGLPDVWKLSHGLSPVSALGDDGPDGDPDGDGFDNRGEFLAGTDPRDPHSLLRIGTVSWQGGVARIGFRAMAGRGYRAEFRDVLTGTDWQVLAELPARDAPWDAVVEDAAIPMGGQRWYRVVLTAW